MTHQQTLEQAIRKAIDGGYELPIYAAYFATEGNTIQLFDKNKEFLGATHCAAIIFDHDFAKSLWRSEPRWPRDDGKKDDYLNWQYHLVEMVLANDPIKYLGEHLDSRS